MFLYGCLDHLVFMGNTEKEYYKKSTFYRPAGIESISRKES